MDEDLDDIFADYEAIRNDDKNAENENENDEQTTDAAQSSQRVAVRKRIVKNPRPKLNAERLCGERGIPTLEKHFENVIFKEGRGYEKENLDKLMAHLEHWAHRLFPSLKFSESLTHIEKLGKKRPVQVCVRKLRLDMPILAQDFIHGSDDEANVSHQTEMDVNNPSESTFDQLVREHQETQSALSQQESFPETHPILEDDTAPRQSSSVASHTNMSLSSSKPAAEQELTEEQKQRIARNKMLAAERRKSGLLGNSSSSVVSNASQSINNQPKDFSNGILDSETGPGSSPKQLQSVFSHSEDEVSISNF